MNNPIAGASCADPPSHAVIFGRLGPFLIFLRPVRTRRYKGNVRSFSGRIDDCFPNKKGRDEESRNKRIRLLHSRRLRHSAPDEQHSGDFFEWFPMCRQSESVFSYLVMKDSHRYSENAGSFRPVVIGRCKSMFDIAFFNTFKSILKGYGVIDPLVLCITP